MDTAYDHITEEAFSSDRAATPTPQTDGDLSPAKPNLNTEFQETFRAFSSSPWGAKLGGLWGNVRKQGGQYYQGARREVEGASGEALRGISGLKETIVKQARNLSLDAEKNQGSDTGGGVDDTTSTETDNHREPSHRTGTESSVIRDDDESLISKFRSEAAKRLKDIEKAEDAADEALLRFGTNIRNFFRDAVTISLPPNHTDEAEDNGKVLFESKDSSGKRVIHTSRFDAQLHVIHCTSDSFVKDPPSGEWSIFRKEFSIDDKTEEISRDLENYPDLRRAMEQLVPEQVDYQDFWCRYYFLRHIIDTEDQKRKRLLQASTQDEEEEEIAWDVDSDVEPDKSSRPSTSTSATLASADNTASTATISHQPPKTPDGTRPKPVVGRCSHEEHSQPDSDASYDVVSGTTTRTPGSPKEENEKPKMAKTEEKSDEEDWE